VSTGSAIILAESSSREILQHSWNTLLIESSSHSSISLPWKGEDISGKGEEISEMGKGKTIGEGKEAEYSVGEGEETAESQICPLSPFNNPQFPKTR
jgi:hypothetical protein